MSLVRTVRLAAALAPIVAPLVPIVALTAGAASSASASLTTLSFVEPTLWSVGDPHTTHQQWDVLANTNPQSPDIASTSNPLLPSSPTLDVQSPGFIASSGNPYSFSNSYGMEAIIRNHGPIPASDTHVVIQIATTVNPDFTHGLDLTSLHLTDLSGNPLTGGDNSDAFAFSQLFTGTVFSSFGEVTYEEIKLEFLLTGWTTDFRIHWTQNVHTSFDVLRVDTAITQAASPVIPEPASIMLSLLAPAALIRRRR
jgi:hypothetical protein